MHSFTEWMVSKKVIGDRLKFMKWYDLEKMKSTMFDLQDELIKYCKEDVNILSQACMCCREIFNPMLEV